MVSEGDLGRSADVHRAQGPARAGARAGLPTKGTVMFLRWGRFVYRHRRLVATIAVLSALASLTLAARVSSPSRRVAGTIPAPNLSRSPGRWPRLRTGRRIAHRPVRGAGPLDATSPAFQGEIATSLTVSRRIRASLR